MRSMSLCYKICKVKEKGEMLQDQTISWWRRRQSKAFLHIFQYCANMRLGEYDSWHTQKFLSTLSKHEGRMFWIVHSLRSFKGRVLINNTRISRGLPWGQYMLHKCYESSLGCSPSLKSHISMSRDKFKNQLSLKLRSVTTEDTALYCYSRHSEGTSVWAQTQISLHGHSGLPAVTKDMLSSRQPLELELSDAWMLCSETVSSTSHLLSWGHHAEHLWRSSCLRASDMLLFLSDILYLRTCSTIIFARNV
jgi:hypothetical protein